MSEKIKAIRGSKERAEEVRQWLIEQGAINMATFTCSYESRLYFVNEGKVDFIDPNYSFLFDVVELPRWRAKFDEEYWYIDDAMDVRCATEDNSRKHDDRHYCGNYFKTEADAEEYRDKFIELLEERE